MSYTMILGIGVSLFVFAALYVGIMEHDWVEFKVIGAGLLLTAAIVAIVRRRRNAALFTYTAPDVERSDTTD